MQKQICLFIIILVVLVMGCSASTEKTPFAGRQTNHPVPEYVKAWTEIYARGSYFFFADDFLWLLGKDRMVLVNPGYKSEGAPIEGRELYYKRFAKDPCSLGARVSKVFARILSGDLDLSGCTALPVIYGMTSYSHLKVERWRPGGSWCEKPLCQMKRGSVFWDVQHDSGFGLVDGFVLISLVDGLYVFMPNGEFVGRRDRKERVTIKDGAVPVGHESALSGPVLVLTKTGLGQEMELTFLDRNTRRVKRILKNMKRFEPDSHTRLREYGDGFYIDTFKTIENKKYYFASDYRPKTWIGETTIDLRSDDELFCYVFKEVVSGRETKKCIPNPDALIVEVIEKDHAIFVFTYDKVYVKRKGWECLGG